jgi:hypothetical protein
LSLKDFFQPIPKKKSNPTFDLRNELARILSPIKWDVKGILLGNGEVIPVPAESRAVTAILQSIAVSEIDSWAKKKGINFEDLVFETRGYPDAALTGGPLGDKLIALDIKSARHIANDKVSRMTLGTYDGYFLHPNEMKLYQGRRCYNDYDEHWVIGFIYDWRPDQETSRMVDILEILVTQKWQIASTLSGSGDTANMGAVDSLSRLRNDRGDFSSEEEFEKYWRSYAVKHPRKGTKAP